LADLSPEEFVRAPGETVTLSPQLAAQARVHPAYIPQKAPGDPRPHPRIPATRVRVPSLPSRLSPCERRGIAFVGSRGTLDVPHT
jgi:hypothetical protein